MGNFKNQILNEVGKYEYSTPLTKEMYDLVIDKMTGQLSIAVAKLDNKTVGQITKALRSKDQRFFETFDENSLEDFILNFGILKSYVSAVRYVQSTYSLNYELSDLPEGIDLNDNEAIREAIDEMSTGWSAFMCEDEQGNYWELCDDSNDGVSNARVLSYLTFKSANPHHKSIKITFSDIVLDYRFEYA